MSTTRALIVLDSGATTVKINDSLPNLAVEGQQYRIRVRAVAISRKEMDWLKKGRTSTFGHAYSGTIDVALFGTCLPVGTNVFGMAPIGSRGAAADYVNAFEKDIAVMPEGMTYEQAATIPLAAFVAWHAFSAGNLDHHPDLLIFGAETAVGQMVQQMVRVVNKQQGWAVYRTCAKRIELWLSGTFETIESLPKCEVVIDCMSDGPKLASWTHTKENGTLITTAPNSSTSRGAWPNIQVREFQVEHLPKKMPTIFGESLLQPLKAEVIDFDDPAVTARLQNLDHKKQVVLRLGLPNTQEHSNVPIGGDNMQRGRPQDNVIDLTGEGKGDKIVIDLTADGEGEDNVMNPAGEGEVEDNAIDSTSEGEGNDNVIDPAGEGEGEGEKNAIDAKGEGEAEDNVIDSAGEGEVS